ncbi:hypothetical protein BpHYR1_053533 [Brachionus plicatilis]|uniref:Uncharacterized protein n=1 Tax=Brachionus plicatilis TaxID=10195 RepID=A0A3M7PE72_BRAPC|nr:hypothetical protein BpHYR1_053533 [Brachionus plicatilis]
MLHSSNVLDLICTPFTRTLVAKLTGVYEATRRLSLSRAATGKERVTTKSGGRPRRALGDACGRPVPNRSGAGPVRAFVRRAVANRDVAAPFWACV